MKKVKSISFFIVFLFLLDFIFYFIFSGIQNVYILKTLELLYVILFTLTLFAFFQTFLYKKAYNFKSKKGIIILYLLVPLLFSYHITDRIVAVNNYYNYAKKATKKATPGLWQADDFLAHKGVPNSKGFYEYFVGDSIHGKVPVHFDKLGFRSVSEGLKIQSDTLNLFLGCSFTFGDYLKAEQTYSYLVSNNLNHNYINAGASAYGFGQMKQLIDSLVPKHNFKYVFIQMSPWLSERSMQLTGPTYYGYRPFPFFSDNNQKDFSLNYPVFNSRMYKNKDWKGTKSSYVEKVQFFATQGKNIEILDYYIYQWNRLKSLFTNKPTTRKKELEKYFYDYAINSCLEKGITPIILKLKYKKEDCSELIDFIKSKKVQVIDLDLPLDTLSESNENTYRKMFSIYHKTKNDSIIIDDHPNSFANKLFSETILEHIKR